MTASAQARTNQSNMAQRDARGFRKVCKVEITDNASVTEAYGLYIQDVCTLAKSGNVYRKARLISETATTIYGAVFGRDRDNHVDGTAGPIRFKGEWTNGVKFDFSFDAAHFDGMGTIAYTLPPAPKKVWEEPQPRAEAYRNTREQNEKRSERTAFYDTFSGFGGGASGAQPGADRGKPAATPTRMSFLDVLKLEMNERGHQSRDDINRVRKAMALMFHPDGTNDLENRRRTEMMASINAYLDTHLPRMI